MSTTTAYRTRGIDFRTPEALQILHLCSYIPDDGTIAGYMGVSRERVNFVRRNDKSPKCPRRFIPASDIDGRFSTGNERDLYDRMHAEDASGRLLRAMSRPICRLANRKRVSFEVACVMAQNGVGGY